MQVAAQQAAAPLCHGIAHVDEDVALFWPDVVPCVVAGPFSCRGPGRGQRRRERHLQATEDGEKQGDTADIGVTEERGASVARRVRWVAEEADGGAGLEGGIV